MAKRWKIGAVSGILCAMSNVTRILSQIEHGDLTAAEQLLPLVNNKLRKLYDVTPLPQKP